MWHGNSALPNSNFGGNAFNMNTEWKRHIQNIWGGKVGIVGGDSIGHCEEKHYLSMCPIMITKIDMLESSTQIVPALFSPDLSSEDFCLWVWWKRTLQKKREFTKQTVGLHFGCCCPQKGRGDRLRQDSSFAQEMQSSFRLTMGFSKIYGQL